MVVLNDGMLDTVAHSKQSTSNRRLVSLARTHNEKSLRSKILARLFLLGMDARGRRARLQSDQDPPPIIGGASPTHKTAGC